MNEHPDPAQRSDPLVHLTNAFENVQGSDTVLTIYDDKTCYEFHKFLVALLFAYTKSLIALKEKQDRTLGYKYFNIALIFWKVGRSAILRIHLNALDTLTGDLGPALIMPNDQWKSVYLSYFEGRDDGGKLAGQHERDDDREQHDEYEEQTEEGDDIHHTLQQFRTNPPSDHGPVTMAQILGRWLLLQTSPFDSLDFLSTFYSNLGAGCLNIQQLAVRPLASPVIDWEAAVMKCVLPEPKDNSDRHVFTHSKAQSVISIIKDRIQAGNQNGHATIIHKFWRMDSNRGHDRSPGIPTKLHCEAAMAALIIHRIARDVNRSLSRYYDCIVNVKALFNLIV
jgi:hypothetical protein